MNILIIDTSRPTIWVALVRDGQMVAEKEWPGDPALGVALLQAIDEVTSRQGPVTRVAVHRGPGHFMALRTGIVTAQLLAWASGAELVEVTGDDRAALIRQAAEASPVSAPTPTY